MSLRRVSSFRKTSNHLCQAEGAGEGSAIAARQSGEGGKSVAGCKGRAGNLLAAPRPLQPDGCNVLLPALQPPRLVQPAQPGNGSEEQNQIKRGMENGRKKTRNHTTAALSGMPRAVRLRSSLASERV